MISCPFTQSVPTHRPPGKRWISFPEATFSQNIIDLPSYPGVLVGPRKGTQREGKRMSSLTTPDPRRKACWHAGKACSLEGPPGSWVHAPHHWMNARQPRPRGPFPGEAHSALRRIHSLEKQGLTNSLSQGPWLHPCQVLG